MGLNADDEEEWDTFRDILRGADLAYECRGDKIIWDGPIKGDAVIVKDIYKNIISSLVADQSSRTFYPFWHRNIPTKILLFGWLVWQGKILTGDNLIKRGQYGPNRCMICCCEEESIEHLFFRCPEVTRLWNLFRVHILDPSWTAVNFMTAALCWDKLNNKYSLPFYLIWEIWLARNGLIFDNRAFNISRIHSVVMIWIQEQPLSENKSYDGSIRIRPHEISVPAIYFDGACVDGITGCGVWLKLSHRERTHIHWNGGLGTNNKAEIMALWGGLLMANNLQLQDVYIYGDSKIVIGWVTNNIAMMNPTLQGWLHRTRSLWRRLNCPPISHVFRDCNTRADGLSKRGLKAKFGIMQVIQFRDGIPIRNTEIPIP